MAHRRTTTVTAGPHGIQRGRGRLTISAAVGLAMLATAVAWICLPTDGRAGEAPTFRGGARLTVDKDLIDLGTQPYNRVVEARFQLKNIGDHALQLPASPPVEVVEGC
jgi:hypothetical protein